MMEFCLEPAQLQQTQEVRRKAHDRLKAPGSKPHKWLLSCAMTQQEKKKIADREVFSIRINICHQKWCKINEEKEGYPACNSARSCKLGAPRCCSFTSSAILYCSSAHLSKQSSKLSWLNPCFATATAGEADNRLLCKDRLCFVSSMIGSYSQGVSQVGKKAAALGMQHCSERSWAGAAPEAAAHFPNPQSQWILTGQTWHDASARPLLLSWESSIFLSELYRTAILCLMGLNSSYTSPWNSEIKCYLSNIDSIVQPARWAVTLCRSQHSVWALLLSFSPLQAVLQIAAEERLIPCPPALPLSWKQAAEAPRHAGSCLLHPVLKFSEI